MRLHQLAGVLALGMLLAGCATSATAPDVVQPLAPERTASLHIVGVTAKAAQGVVMTSLDLERICDKVKAQMNAASPGIMVSPSSPDAATAMTMNLDFTRYDSGNAFARAMMMGLGQIHIDADVTLVDPLGKTDAEYKVSKQFAFGGIYGGVTRIEDVEDGFAKSVAEIVQKKK